MASSGGLFVPDAKLEKIAEWFRNYFGGAANLENAFRRMIRQGLDEVIDGPRTHRYCVQQLEKTEKTYIGTKIEILIRAELGHSRGELLDLSIDGEEVDVKFTVGKNWMIPLEAKGQVCLLVFGNEDERSFGVGLLRMDDDHLSAGVNQDKKASLSPLGRERITWLARGELPLNYLATLSDEVRKDIFAQRSGQKRVTALMRGSIGRLVPRLAIETVASQKDPMKRLRRNGGCREELIAEGILALSGEWDASRTICEMLGVQPPGRGEVAVVRPPTDLLNAMVDMLP